MKAALSEIASASLNLIFPIYCQGCGIKLSYNNKDYLCLDCIKKIRLTSPAFCLRCGKHLNGPKDIETVCPDCLCKNYYFKRAWQCSEYDGIIKELIHKFKYNRKIFLKNILGKLLFNFAKEHIDCKRIDLITTVPMHKSELRNRGFNQGGILSECLSKSLNIPYNGNIIRKHTKTLSQVGLKRAERLHNIRGAFSSSKDGLASRKNLLLIDDVYTTGSTVNECSKALIESGANTVYVLVLAGGNIQ